MLRIRTGARHGLRWGVFGFVAAVFTIPGNPAQAAPYADIVVDANSGAVLHSTNPDARRHPASLTKIMTLYMLFEQLDAGTLKLDSQLKVSAEAAAQAPTKLGLKPGSTIAVEDAIKGLVTRSANDAAVVVAEAIAGTERDFAKLMTRKAQALGMKNTVYKNASGLPDSDQITTARDQSMLGRAVQERFPRYYKYFSIRTFTFRGQSISNHNHLLGRVEGVDGIKTGYINASGFNLVTSVHRGNRYLVAVVMGGGSAGSRDARMRELINGKIVLAATKRTAPMVGESVETADAKPEPKAVAKAEPAPEAKSEPKVAAKVEPKPEPSVEAKAETKAEPRFAVASAVSAPTRFIPSTAPTEAAAVRSEPTATAAAAQPRLATGSTEPIRPVLVKTLAVRAGTQTASLAPLVPALPVVDSQPTQAAAPAPSHAPVVVARPEPPAPPAPAPAAAAPVAVTRPEPAAAPPAPAVVAARLDPPSPAPAPLVVAKPEPTASAPAAVSTNAERLPLPLARPGTLGVLPARTAAAQAAATAKPAPAPIATAATPAPAAASKPPQRGGWVIQVGAFPAEGTAKERLAAVRSKASKVLTGAEGFTEPVQKSGTIYYRARFAGLDRDRAEAACKYLKKNDVECVPLKN
jgi:D-alanyl-D-alanine carboxypeptidase